MLNTPDDALEHIKPFVPTDMHLAKVALAKELGVDCPDWVVDGILFLLSNTIMMEIMKEKVRNRYGDHWLPDTLPYLLDFGDIPNLN